MFLKLDGTFFVQLLNFAIFFALLNVVFLRPVGNAIRKRREYLNSLVTHYDLYREQAANLQAQADAARTAARREAEATLAKMRAQTSNDTAAIAEDFARRSTATAEDAQQTAAAELDAARAGREPTVRDLAGMMVERVLAEAAS